MEAPCLLYFRGRCGRVWTDGNYYKFQNIFQNEALHYTTKFENRCVLGIALFVRKHIDLTYLDC